MTQENKAKKGQCNNYTIFIASRYFETIDDYINLELGCKRFMNNMTKFHYNPIALNETTREFFPSLQSLFIYDRLNDNQFINDERIKQRKEIKIEKYNLFVDEKKQIEEWTGMEMREVFFDSNKPEDTWSVDDCNLHEKIDGRRQLVCMIEDDEGNKFGYYFNTEVENVVLKDQPTDDKTFAFSLVSNGRCDGMMRFNITNEGKKEGFILWDKSDGWLFRIGYDIRLYKKNRNQGDCYQDGFDYNGIDCALCGKYGCKKPFTINRFVVIQMKRK